MTNPLKDLGAELAHRSTHARMAADASADYLNKVEAARRELNQALNSINAGKLQIAQDCAHRAQRFLGDARTVTVSFAFAK